MCRLVLDVSLNVMFCNYSETILVIFSILMSRVPTVGALVFGGVLFETLDQRGAIRSVVPPEYSLWIRP